MVVIQQLLKIWHKQGHRVLLFTQGRQVSLTSIIRVARSDHKFLDDVHFGKLHDPRKLPLLET
jgi:hypothetical protein